MNHLSRCQYFHEIIFKHEIMLDRAIKKRFNALLWILWVSNPICNEFFCFCFINLLGSSTIILTFYKRNDKDNINY